MEHLNGSGSPYSTPSNSPHQSLSQQHDSPQGSNNSQSTMTSSTPFTHNFLDNGHGFPLGIGTQQPADSLAQAFNGLNASFSMPSPTLPALSNNNTNYHPFGQTQPTSAPSLFTSATSAPSLYTGTTGPAYTSGPAFTLPDRSTPLMAPSYAGTPLLPRPPMNETGTNQINMGSARPSTSSRLLRSTDRVKTSVGSQGRRGILPCLSGRNQTLPHTNGRASPQPLRRESDGKWGCVECDKWYQHLKHYKRHWNRRKFQLSFLLISHGDSHLPGKLHTCRLSHKKIRILRMQETDT